VHGEHRRAVVVKEIIPDGEPVDNSELNRVIGCAFTMLNTLGAESFDASAKAKNILLEKCKR
jgi:hypothetical protein